MKIRTILIICAISICYAVSWGQTWKLTETMTAKLDKNVFTVSTTKNAEEMPDYNWVTLPLWFEERGGIHSVVIADKVTSVGTWAFMHCANIKTVTLSNSVTSIGGFGFYNCYNLESVTMSAKLETIAGAAFKLCESLSEIEIPASVSLIGGEAFLGCKKLKTIRVNADNPDFSSDNSVLYNKNKTILILYSEGKNDAIFEIPSTVEIIESSAFNNASFDSISIPNSVQEIRDNAFGLCTNLTSITIPNSVIRIENHAFTDCTGLITVTIERANPLALNDSTFRRVSLKSATLRVPTGRTKAYQEANVWKDFGKFVEFNFDYSSIEQTRRDGTCPVSAWAHDGILHITGLQPGKPFQIFNLAGQYIYKGIAKSEEVQIALPTSGIYVVSAEEQSTKVIVK